ncbi:MAG TPA: prepilin-type N-terminal cleavage/methylation domain-containing protein [Gallionella sp.]|nr:prepilin-type N-terminal cleavage/methylation domain-containing protein [Gallionella sp.]
MKKVQKGFTLIELMIVVAIIGILAAVAIPAYQDYIVKAKLSKAQSTMDALKLALAMSYQENGGFPVGTATVTTPGGGTAAAGSVWASLGLGADPILPGEVAKLEYVATACATCTTYTDNFAVGLELANIKAATIDGQNVAFSPVPGATVAAATAPVPATAGVAQGVTALQWYYSCSTAMDKIAFAYFKCQ